MLKKDALVASCGLVGPITSLAHSPIYNSVVYGAIGGNLIVLDMVSGECVFRQLVFSNHIVDSIVVDGMHPTTGIAIGDNYVTLLNFPTRWEVSMSKVFENLDDRVLDAGMVNVNGFPILLIGYANNFVDVVRVLDGATVSRVHAPTSSCMLFSMSLACNCVTFRQNENTVSVPIASGTALGKIELWECHLHTTSDIEGEDDGKCLIATAAHASNGEMVLEGHEGSIFRMKWSIDGRQLASVSDDRTVRLWDVSSGAELWTGWGHICRVWDVCFITQRCKNSMTNCDEDADIPILASCSEDGSVRTWSAGGRCLSSFCGHGKNVWRIVAVDFIHSSDVCKPYVVSGGNDGKVCIWDVERASLSNRCVVDINHASKTSTQKAQAQDAGGATVFPVPQWNRTIEDGAVSVAVTEDKDKRRINGCSNVFVAPDTRRTGELNSVDNSSVVFVVLTDGGIWCLDAHASADRQWTPVCYCAETVVAADCHFACLNGSNRVVLVLAHGNGGATVVRFEYTISSAAFSDNNTGRILFSDLERRRWNAHKIKTVCAWALGTFQIGNFPSFNMIATASVKGQCAVWFCQQGCENSVPFGFSCVTGGGHIATTSSLVYHHKLTGTEETFIVAFGDCRGSITFSAFECGSGLSLKDACADASNVAFFSRVHDTDPVTAITAIGKNQQNRQPGCISLGQNGLVVVYSITVTHSSTSIQIISRATSFPISFPDYVCFAPAATPAGAGTTCGSESDPMLNNNVSVYIGGYTGDEYLICEFSKENRLYQLLRVGAGGWKRPHCCLVRQRYVQEQSALARSNTKLPPPAELPWVSFVNCIPLKAGTDVVLTTNYATDSDTGSIIGDRNRVASLPPCIKNLPPSFGKVGYCCAAIESAQTTGKAPRYFVVGGEDGVLKAFAHLSDGDSATVGGLRIVQEMTMRGFTPARAMVACSASTGVSAGGARGILVACGGKLMYSIWTYDFSSNDNAILPPLDCYFRLQVNGATTWDKATQDHRLLTTSCVSWNASSNTGVSSDEIFVVVLGDSRGMVTLVAYTWSTGSCELIDEFECSEFPILVSSVIRLPSASDNGGVSDTQSFVGFFGDSDGTVFSYLFTISLATQSLATKTFLGSFEAHDMGVNCIACSRPIAINNTKINSDADASELTVIIASGGDDQALCVAAVKLRLYRHPASSSSNEVAPIISPTCLLSLLRREGASGSAIKGVDFVAEPNVSNDSKVSIPLVAVGYDRRLFLWNVQFDSTSSAAPHSSFSNDSDATSLFESGPFFVEYDNVAIASSAVVDAPISVVWRGGAPVHVSDIGGCCVAATSGCSSDLGENAVVGVVGEGFQLFSCHRNI